MLTLAVSVTVFPGQFGVSWLELIFTTGGPTGTVTRTEAAGPEQPSTDVETTEKVVLDIKPLAVGDCNVALLRNDVGVHEYVLAVAGMLDPYWNETFMVWLGAKHVAVLMPPQLELLISGRIT